MAKKKNTSNPTFSTETNAFIKGMNKDLNSSFVPKQSWFHARNAYNNSADGDAGTIGNEPANLRCSDVPYPIIGAIYKQGDEWFIYCTDDISSEIGLLDDSKCEYTTIINDPCLNFKRTHLITGAAKENYDCTWQVYWDDNLNPSRTLNVDNIPYVQIETQPPGSPCIIYEDTTDLDCEKIRLAPLVQTPCLELTRDIDGGVIRNGSYQAYVAYVVNEQKVTDYIGVSNIQSLFVHDDVGSSLNIKLTNLDQNFEFYELVILSNTKEQVVAKKIGIYSTEQNSVSIDFIDPATTSVPLEQLFNRAPAYERSESMYVVNDYLIRQGPTEQFDFNYQPLANQIQARWQVAEYSADYYHKGGNKTSFMRDEQYAFFIRFIYNTGERSASYHIPGRAPYTNGFTGNGRFFSGDSEIGNSTSLGNVIYLGTEQNWQALNTATVTSSGLNIQLDDGGVIISEGEMGYWQSSERYPATKPEIWEDLCGLNIRHHKMPSEEVHESLNLSDTNNEKIRLLGVKFLNIQRPVFNDGTVIPNIVAYEILRGSREGAKSIMAKGIFRNMRRYNIPDDENTIGNPQGLYPNYPYNDLNDDIYFHTGTGNTGKRTENLIPLSNQLEPLDLSYAPALKGYTRDVFTFHTPELPFRKPYLNAYETRIYGKYKGESVGYFRKSEDHPGQKLLLNYPIVYAALLGMGYALLQFKGKKNQTNLPLQFIHSHPGLAFDITGEFAFGSGEISTKNVSLSQPAIGQAPGVLNYATYLGVGGNFSNTIIDLILDEFLSLGDLLDLSTGGLKTETEQDTLNKTTYGSVASTGGTMGGGINIEFEGTNFKSLPTLIRAIMGIPGFLVYTAEGANVLIDLFYNLMSYQDYALKHNSHGSYTTLESIGTGIYRAENFASNYIGSSFNIFGDTQNGLYKINNLFRPDTIIIGTDREFDHPFENEDRSRYTLGSLEPDFTGVFSGKNSYKGRNFRRPICSLYGALKFKIDNQYGQLEGVKQTPMRGCVQYLDLTQPQGFAYETESFFTGDVYINRYTEKTIMPIFTDFLYGQPDGYVYDYLKYTNLPYPRYWMNTERYDFTKIYNVFSQLPSIFSGNANQYFTILPSDLYSLDVSLDTAIGNGVLSFFTGGLSALATQSLFAVTNGYMYTHVNGVQDFFVESELNIAQRDWQEAPEKRHYDPYLYSNLNDLFHANIIKKDNFYLYDYSLSASRFITNLTNFAAIQPRDYDPLVAETCFTFYPKRLIYSLRAQEEAKKDFWRVFLANNYKDFKNKVSVIKPVNQTGALMFFPYASPKMFAGVDQLQTDLGTKVILGDGGLFAQEPKNITNSDLANEYASCESARSVINTPQGIFFISQAQGKIFHYTGKLTAISDLGMKWWFNKYLPSILLKQFPELEGTELEDNPVVGIGCQAIYDINDDIVYFMKKDYAVKEGRLEGMSFNPETLTFTFSTDITSFPVALGDPDYFDDVSWTVSYDPKIKGWISFHDWHPELSLPSINHFLTTKTFTSEELLCPPGYSLIDGVCVSTIQETAPGFVNIEEVESIFTGGPENCLIDIVIAVDTSGSTGGAGGPVGSAERSFVSGFLNNSTISAAMAAGSLQVGFTSWSYLAPVSMNPLGFSMSNTITPPIVNAFYTNNWLGAGTLIQPNIAHAQSILNNKANSELGDRTSQPGFRQYIIFVTDTTTAPPSNVGCPFQSSTLGGSAVANQFLIALYAGPNSAIPPNPGVLSNISCNSSAYEFGINASQPSTITAVVDAVAATACGSEIDCNCPDGFTLVYPDTSGTLVTYTEQTGDCITTVTTTIPDPNGGNNGGTLTQTCDCFLHILDATIIIPSAITYIDYISCDGTVVQITGPSWPTTIECARIDSFTNNFGFPVTYYKALESSPCDSYVCCPCMTYQLTAAWLGGGILEIEYQDCDENVQTLSFSGNYQNQEICAIPGSIVYSSGNQALMDSLVITEFNQCGTFDCGDGNDPTGGTITVTAEFPAICRRINCGCPDPINPDSTVEQIGDCEDVDIYQAGDPTYQLPVIQCIYSNIDEVQPSNQRGSIWRHNYRCDLYANYYDVDYPWEVELVENTGQMVNIVKSMEYQLETYVYRGDLHDGCGDDRWHDLDFNFDKAIIYNSEQVSGLLTLIPHPKEDPLNMINYPIIGGTDIQILYSKEEQKFRFNQFWDITADRGEFTNAEQNIFITRLNGYIKDLNFQNLLYSKPSNQRKKFRHYYNKVILRRTLSGNRKMLLKLNNTKLNLSMR